MSVSPMPEGYATITPYLSVRGASEALTFYAEAFGAQERFRLEAPDGAIMHAETEIYGQAIMLADEMAEMDFLGPQSRGGCSCSLMLYVPDVDAAFARALAAGATEVRAVEDQFYGDRMGTLKDPFGHVWFLGMRVEEVSEDEIHRRFQAMFTEPGTA